jgi:hypothetical protein
MVLIVGIVFNHVGVDRPDANRWGWDVLTHGRKSVCASFFDIDWEFDNGMDGRITSPVLGSDDVADSTFQDDTLRPGGPAFRSPRESVADRDLGALPSAPPADRVAERAVRLPRLRDHHPGRIAPGGPRNV